MSKMQKKACGNHWRHAWEYIDDRQKCTRCKRLNPLWVSAQIRFWDHVDKSGTCWLWTGDKNQYGYGRYRTPRKYYLAHRYAWIISGRALPLGMKGHNPMQLDHICKNRACVRVGHLQLLTLTEHARQRRKKYCKRGHRQIAKNRYVAPSGRSRCWLCIRKVKSA